MLPQPFIDYTSALFGPERWQRFLAAMDEQPPVSVRLNPFKPLADADSAMVDAGTPVPWCRHARYLDQRPQFTLDPLLHAGCYYVQEAGSMFLDHVLRHLVHTPVRMLDLCAAPGGKSTLARAALPDGSWLFSNEPDRRRANILMENLQKQGHPQVTVTNGFARDYQRSRLQFDVILCDVPCSGEGMFRKDSGAIGEWSLANVQKCALLQRSIIDDIWSCLAPGGILIYSTCTFNLHEDEENVQYVIDTYDAEPVSVPVQDEWHITGNLMPGSDVPVYRFIPGTTQSEGLFMAVLRKPGCDQLPCSLRQGSSKNLKSLHIIHDGSDIRGEQKGRDVIPAHAEALSVATPSDRYPRWQLTHEEALTFLHREPLLPPVELPRGYCLVTYQTHPLGFVKNLGNRANNLYPKEWAIRQQVK